VSRSGRTFTCCSFGWKAQFSNEVFVFGIIMLVTGILSKNWDPISLWLSKSFYLFKLIFLMESWKHKIKNSKYRSYGYEVDWSNNVLTKFIFFFWMPFVRKALFLYVLANKRSLKKNKNFERNSNKKKPYECTKIFVRITLFRKTFFFQKIFLPDLANLTGRLSSPNWGFHPQSPAPIPSKSVLT
jgi:hypothetical protein